VPCGRIGTGALAVREGAGHCLPQPVLSAVACMCIVCAAPVGVCRFSAGLKAVITMAHRNFVGLLGSPESEEEGEEEGGAAQAQGMWPNV